jgi:adenylate kinase family enzyme
MQILTARLSTPDCLARGWLLDGFPHTKGQAARLAAAGFEPDKVVFLEGSHALLAQRVR